MSVDGFGELMLEDGILSEAVDHLYKLSTQLILGFVEAGMIRVDGDDRGIVSPRRVSGNNLGENVIKQRFGNDGDGTYKAKIQPSHQSGRHGFIEGEDLGFLS
jgi:hypothetical protein